MVVSRRFRSSEVFANLNIIIQHLVFKSYYYYIDTNTSYLKEY